MLCPLSVDRHGECGAFVCSWPFAAICAREPERAARHIVEKGYESRYEVAFDVLKSLS
jgi:hypothetical protein